MRAFTGIGVRLFVILGLSVTLFFTLIVVGTAFIVTSEDGVRTIVSDFRVLWAAARLAVAGEPLAAFDLARLAAEYNAASQDWMPWLYPPGYHILIAPLGTLPYAVAFFFHDACLDRGDGLGLPGLLWAG